jgi:hypothetical protein
MGPFSASKQSPYEESAAQKYELGTKWVYGDGRIFRYAKNGGVALGKAKMTQTQVVETKLLEVAQTAHAQAAGVRDITVLVTTGSALAENALAGGTLWANKINQLGDSYRIVASKLQSTDTLLDLKLETPIRTALLATTELSIAPNKYYGVVVFPTTTTGSPTGVPLIDVSIGYYFWSQTGGDAPLYVDSGETAVIGNLVGPPGTYAVPGAGGVWVTLTCPWGSWRTVNAADEVGLVDLWLDR